MKAADLLTRLDGVRPRGHGRWAATCPAHEDRFPSLSIRQGSDGRLLVHDFGGCSVDEICSAIGLRVSDLFDDAPTSRPSRPAPRCIDRRALAFQFELGALDLRLRAKRIARAANNVNVNALTADELDRALGHIAQAHADRARAALLEGVADGLRERATTERVRA